MTAESTLTKPSTFLEKQIDRLSRPRALVAVGLVLTLLLIGAAYLDGILARFFDDMFWRVRLTGPVITVYLLLMFRLLNHYSDRAIEAFRSLVVLDDDDFDRLVAEVSTLDLGREWLALGIGAAFGVAVVEPWNWPHGFSWLNLYGLLTEMLMFGLLGWMIYLALAKTRLFTELHRHPLNLDIFDPTPLEPIAQRSLATSLVFLGGATLSVLLIPYREWLLSVQSLILYGVVILVSVLVFFLSMMSTHRAMAEVKEQELKLARHNLSAAIRELKERVAKGQLEDIEALSYSITTWVTYEKRIEAAPEWPYTTDTLRNLIVSTLLPVLAWLAQVIIEFIT